MSQGAMTVTDAFKAGFLKRYDTDGTVWVQAIAHGTLVAKTPYGIIVNEYGQVSAALTNTAASIYVGVPHQAAVAGDLVWFQIGGPLTGMVVLNLEVAVGHALTVANSTIVDSGVDYTGLVSQFAVCTEATAAGADLINVILVPERVITTVV